VGTVFQNVPANYRSRFRATHSASWGSAPQKAAAARGVPAEEAEEGECSSDEDGEEDDRGENDASMSLLSAAVVAELGGAKLRLCAIDCEMCTTAAGLELTRISIVSPEIESFVSISSYLLFSFYVTLGIHRSFLTH